ncbi:hypothetical protein PCL_10300 [Purpureocillium lilacinum]|uniref:Membrane-associating domain-containing protein n=1 Tax=Purpureocillium lilacinum TaxID=33203 RepID=A0A179GE28_PURLI|nr:membrane-associating domain-containing protein [Purpureocillium lilacinum]PWI73285.1 hypothetical protein PCL_10300 [Purpureocillium lilacinum]GJN70479.1 hypothetical protein PLICBS_004537 [Purpureocillium lilacinum]
MSAQRAPGREHIPNYPRGWVVLRSLQLFFCLIILGLGAYSLYLIPYAVGSAMAMFTSVITFAISIWLITAHTCQPRSFNYWAALVFDILLYIWWLTSFSLCAVQAVGLFAVNSIYCDKYGSDWYNDDYDDAYNELCGNRHGRNVIHGGVVAGMAGLGALEFLFFFISWVTDAVVIHKHRRAGLHNRPVKPGSAGAPYQVQLQPQFKSNYEAVPQQGVPFHAQETAYNPQGMYNPPTQGFPPQQASPYSNHGAYGAPVAPLAAQHTGNSFQKAASPQPQGGFPAPYPSQSPHQAHPYAQPPPVVSPAPYNPHQGY